MNDNLQAESNYFFFNLIDLQRVVPCQMSQTS